MPFALLIIGLILVITGAKDTHRAMGSQLAKDFTGQGNFFWWLAAIFLMGAVGKIPGMQNFSRALMGLVIVVLLISNKGIFANLTSALQGGPLKTSADHTVSNADVVESGVRDNAQSADVGKIATTAASMYLGVPAR